MTLASSVLEAHGVVIDVDQVLHGDAAVVAAAHDGATSSAVSGVLTSWAPVLKRL